MKVAVFHANHATPTATLIAQRFPDLDITTSHDEDTARRAVVDANILVCQMSFPGSAFSDVPKLRWVQMMSAGVEQILPSIPKDVRISRLTGSFGPRMAEYSAAYILAITQQIPTVLDNQRAKRWDQLVVGVARGKTAGVAGLGSIGSAHVRLLDAIGMEVIGYSRSMPNLPELRRWYGPTEWHEFLGAADFVILCLPLTPESRRLVDADALRAMRPDAWLINTARGGLVDETALIEALRRGRPSGAVLDVFAIEPLPQDSPLWDMPNVIVTPHHSGETSIDEAVEIFAENLPRFLTEQPLINEVDRVRGY